MLNHHVHGGPVGRHQHDLREAIMYTAEGRASRLHNRHYSTFLRALTRMTLLESTKANPMLRALSKYTGNRMRPENC